MGKPILSVIIPVYNVEKYLAKCIDSVLAQGINEIEIILINDGSKDSSGEIADRYASSDARIKSFHVPNSGSGKARNYGLDHANGEYVTFIDSDDWWIDGSLGGILNRLIETDADIALFDYEKGNADGSVSPIHMASEPLSFDSPVEINNVARAIVNPVSGFIGGARVSMSVWSAIFRRTLLTHRFRSEREIVSEDLLFKVEAVLKSHKVIYLPVIVNHYRYTLGSLTNTFLTDKFHKFTILADVLREIFSATPTPNAGNGCMIYALSALTHHMYKLNVDKRVRKQCFRNMSWGYDWRSMKIDRSNVFSIKERLMVWLMRSKSWRTAWAISEIYYGFKRGF